MNTKPEGNGDTNQTSRPDKGTTEGSRAEIARSRRKLVAAEIAQLPPFGSTEFWKHMEPQSQPLISPEVLVWAAKEFHLQNKSTDRDRIFSVLYDRYDPVIRKWAHVSRYVRGNQAYVDDTSSYTWNRLVSILLTDGKTYLTHDRFTWAFEAALLDEVKTNARTVVRQGGGGVPMPSNKPAHGQAAEPEKRKDEDRDNSGDKGAVETRTKYKMSPRQNQTSLYAPLPVAEGEDPVSLLDILPDPRAEKEYDLVLLLHTLLPELESTEKEILMLLVEGHDESPSSIAKALHIDRGTAVRRLQSIRSKASRVRALTEVS